MSNEVYTNIRDILALDNSSRTLRESLGAYYKFLDVRAGEWVALQALNAKQYRVNGAWLPAGTYTTFSDTLEGTAKLCEDIDAKQTPQGVYVLHARLADGVQSRQDRRSWIISEKGASLTDKDFCARRAAFIDLDPERPTGVSAKKSEMALAFSKAAVLWTKFVEILTAINPEGPRSLALGASGNGCQIHVALADLAATEENKELSKRFLDAADGIWTDEKTKVDVKVFDIKRLAPAFGSMKRKGSNDEEGGRPHRRSWFVPACEETYRLTEEEFTAFVEALEDMVPGDVTVDADSMIDDVNPRITSSGKKAGATTKAAASNEDNLVKARSLPLRDVASWLGILEGDNYRCPGCGETEGVGQHPQNASMLHCFHNRCAARPNKTTIDLVMSVRKLEGKAGIKEAYKLLAAQFGLPELRGPGRPKSSAVKACRAPVAATGADWESTLTLTEKGAIASTEANAITILMNTGWPEVFRFNERTRKIEFTMTPPWHPEHAPMHVQKAGDTLTDSDFDRVRFWLQKNWLVGLSKDSGFAVMKNMTEKKVYNSLTDWLNNLVWDGVPRLSKWTQSYERDRET